MPNIIKTRYGDIEIPTEPYIIGIQNVFGADMMQVYIPLMMHRVVLPEEKKNVLLES